VTFSKRLHDYHWFGCNPFNLERIEYEKRYCFPGVYTPESRVAIVTGEEDLGVVWRSLYIRDRSSERKTFDRSGICLFGELQNQKKYVVEIQRT